MDLGPHLELGGKNLLQCLSAEKNYLPYWHMAVGEDLRAEYEFRPHCTGHNVDLADATCSTAAHLP